MGEAPVNNDRKALEEEQCWRIGQSRVASEMPSLKTCQRHPGVHYDGPECPGCAADREFLLLTESTDIHSGPEDA